MATRVYLYLAALLLRMNQFPSQVLRSLSKLKQRWGDEKYTRAGDRGMKWGMKEDGQRLGRRLVCMAYVSGLDDPLGWHSLTERVKSFRLTYCVSS